MNKALVLISGGIDSAVTLWWALKKGWESSALTFDYHRRPRSELRATRALLKSSGVERLIEVPLPFLKEVEDLPKKDLHNEHILSAPEGYIPARNMVFYSLAFHYAEILGAKWIVGGHNGGDSQMFPDAGQAFFQAMNSLSSIALWSSHGSPIEIVLPLSGMKKEDVLLMGLDLGVPFHLTWSCYWEGTKHCGKCQSCVERRKAFRAIGKEDPVQYAH